MSNQTQYKFLDLVGVGILKEELDKVFNNSEQDLKKYADDLNKEMDTRVDAVENTSHTHANENVLKNITSSKVTNWDEVYRQVSAVFDVYTENGNELSDVLMSIDSNATEEAKSYVDNQIRLLPNTYYTETEIDNKISELNDSIDDKAHYEHEHNYAGSSTVGGSATSAEKLSVERTISLTGDVTGSGKFDGSKDMSITVTVADDSHNHIVSNVDGLQDALDESIVGLSASGKTITYTRGDGTTETITTQDTIYTHPNSGVTAGTYKSVTVDAKGHITAGTNPTTLAGYGITDAEAKGTASNTVSIHNTSTSAHNDIRLLISDLNNKVTNFLDVDETTTDQLSEIIALIEANADDIDKITSGKINVSDIVNNLTTNVSNKPLSASQGVALKGLIDALQIAVNGKSDDSHTHEYAGSSTVGGSANSAVKLDSSAGSKTQPIYFKDGKPVATTYTLNKSVPSDAVFTDTVYTHPSYTAKTGVPTANQTPAFGGTFSVTQPVSDASGHITAMNSRTITIPKTEATTSAAGLMSASDKIKLNNIADGANNYTLQSAGLSLGGVLTGGDVTITDGIITVNDDSHNHIISNIDGLQDELDNKSPKSHSHAYYDVYSQKARDLNVLYDAGLYLCGSGTTNQPCTNGYGVLFGAPYRKRDGNASPDFGAQIFLPNGDDGNYPNSMFYRTALKDSWNQWNEVATKQDMLGAMSATITWNADCTVYTKTWSVGGVSYKEVYTEVSDTQWTKQYYINNVLSGTWTATINESNMTVNVVYTA